MKKYLPCSSPRLSRTQRPCDHHHQRQLLLLPLCLLHPHLPCHLSRLCCRHGIHEICRGEAGEVGEPGSANGIKARLMHQVLSIWLSCPVVHVLGQLVCPPPSSATPFVAATDAATRILSGVSICARVILQTNTAVFIRASRG